MHSQTLTQVSIEPRSKNRQTSPTSEACSTCALKTDSAPATTSMLQAPFAIHYTAAPCRVLVANVQMVVPLLATQHPDSSELGTWTHTYLANVSIAAECVACFKADCHHSCFKFCNATNSDCDSSKPVRQVDVSAQRYLVMPCRPAQSKSTKTTRSTSLPSVICPIMLGNRTSPCTVGCLCPSSCTVACF